ncbi:MAG TPA: histidine--tRNA ligase, partial [Candidatus Polarisedimenticolaceae bacterium]|nr:histidine--tRNA ligase [Candidatus Polarisedimenticolaceae bacterium]
NTASVARAFVEHSLHRRVSAGFPERLYYIGPMFRHERPQKGRQRQFHQVGAEVLGAAEPIVDAEMMQMLDLFLDTLGVGGRELLIASVGDAACRPAYREILREWLEPRLGSLCDDCRRRHADNPLRVLDCKVERDRAILAEAPLLADHLCRDCAGHFAEVERLLERYGLRYRVDPRLVRGLDYYQRTVFEVIGGGLGAQDAILGGGRYDGLVEQLGGPSMPAIGFAMGIERALLAMPDGSVESPGIDLLLVALGDDGWRAAVELASELRRNGVRVLYSTCPRPMGAQLKRADRAGARYALFIGADELAAGSFALKDLRTGRQQSMTLEQVITRIGDDHA